MSDTGPDDDSRRALREEAERLRRQRLDAEAAAASATREAVARHATADAARQPRRLRASLAPSTPLAVLASATGALFAAMVAFAQSEGSAVNAVGRGLLALALVALAGVVARYAVLAPRRYRRWLASRPFAVDGLTEALSASRAASEAWAWLEPVGEAPPADVVRELLAARLPVTADAAPPRVEVRDGALAVVRTLSAEASNAPLHRWVVALTDGVLAEVHRGWPLRAVGVEVTEHTGFDTGSGD